MRHIWLSPFLLPALLLAGFLLRVQGIDWDQSRGLHPDEGNLLRAAAALGPGNWIPKFHAYNDLALWLPKYAALPFCDSANLACLRSAARLLSALASGLSVWALAAIAQRLAGGLAMHATALLAATSIPLIQWAHFGTTESLLVLLVTLLWLQALRWQLGEIGLQAFALSNALLLGGGFGVKTSALAMALIPLTALIITRGPLRPRLGAALWALPLTAALMLAATPSLIFAWQDWLAAMRFEAGVVAGTLRVFWTRQFDWLAAPPFHLAQIWGSMAGIGVLLAFAGLWQRRWQIWRGLLPAMVFTLGYGAICFGWHAAFFRYLAPIFPFLLLLAGLGAANLLGAASASLRMLAATGLAALALLGLDFAASYQAQDPRVLAEAELQSQAPAGAIVGVEPYEISLTGPLERLDLPLDGNDPAALAAALSEVDFLLVSSRRNWAVLPNHPETPLACAYFAALTRGELGFRLMEKFHRKRPLYPLNEGGLQAEETRQVFDRPEVYLLARESLPDRAALTERLSARLDPESCRPAVLAQNWQKPR